MKFYNPNNNTIVICKKVPITRAKKENWYIIPSTWTTQDIMQFSKENKK